MHSATDRSEPTDKRPMATEIRVPTLGESVTEATIGKWFKKVGDPIAAEEPIVELETDKVTIEVPAPAGGTLSEISAREGETVGLGALLGTIDGAAAAKPDAVAQAGGNAGAATMKEAVEKTAKIAGEPAIREKKTEMPAAPAAAKMLAESNLSADQVTGSGKRGQVLKGDVIAEIGKGLSTPAQPAAPIAARAPSPAGDEVREERI